MNARFTVPGGTSTQSNTLPYNILPRFCFASTVVKKAHNLICIELYIPFPRAGHINHQLLYAVYAYLCIDIVNAEPR